MGSSYFGVMKMKILQNDCEKILQVCKNLHESEDLKIVTKYKILKIEQILQKEVDLIMDLLKDIGEKYGEEIEEGKIKIKKEYENEVKKQISDLEQQAVQLPDLYFSLDEFENLSWDNLEALMPFIKE